MQRFVILKNKIKEAVIASKLTVATPKDQTKNPAPQEPDTYDPQL
jgi:hypothetical protein